MTFYDRTKEDSRPWRTEQDTLAQNKDDAAVATSVEVTAQGNQLAPLFISPLTVAVGAKVQITTRSKVPNLVYEINVPARATVNATGEITGVSAGATSVIVKQVVKGVTTQRFATTLTVTA